MQELNKTLTTKSKKKINKRNKYKQTKNSRKKRFWSDKQDRILKLGVKMYGNKKWSQISKLLKNRDSKRCRQRWFNYLNQKNKTWNVYDLWILFLAFKIYGNKWSQISRMIDRGDNIVKNKIICMKRKGMSYFEQKLRKLKENQNWNNNVGQLEQKLLRTLIGAQEDDKKDINHTHLQTQKQNSKQQYYSQINNRYNYQQMINYYNSPLTMIQNLNSYQNIYPAYIYLVMPTNNY